LLDGNEPPTIHQPTRRGNPEATDVKKIGGIGDDIIVGA